VRGGISTQASDWIKEQFAQIRRDVEAYIKSENAKRSSVPAGSISDPVLRLLEPTLVMLFGARAASNIRKVFNVGFVPIIEARILPF